MSMAITGTVLYLLFILAFIIHDGEEIAMEHKWLLAHGDALCEKTLAMQWELLAGLCQIQVKLIGKRLNGF